MARVFSENRRVQRTIAATVALWLAGGSLLPAVAAEARLVSCRTDKQLYTQGEKVILTVANMSEHDISVVDRSGLDAGVATIERRDAEDRWSAIELYAAAAPSVFKVLKPGEQHVYVVEHDRLQPF